MNYNTYAVSSNFLYYENTGSPSSPQFSTPTVNQFGLTSSPTIVYTTLGDIDNDGDTDILGFSFDYSTYAANFLFIENIGSPTAPNFSSPQLNVFGIPSGIFSLLALEDIDTDGDLDIIFTQENYNSTDFGYVENTGTAAIPQYNPPPTQNPFGLSFPNWQGGGIPNFKDLDGDGDNDLIGGTDDDFISYFENVGVQQPVTYECINYSCVDPGTGSGSYTTLSSCQTNCTAPVSYDCDWVLNSCYDPGDGSGNYTSYNDCILDCTPQPTWDCVAPGNCQDPGNGSGNYWSLQDCQNACGATPSWNCDASLGCIDPGDGTGLYTSLTGCQANCNSTSIENTEINTLKLYPNPVNNTLNVSSDKKINKIEIYDALGRVIYTENNPSSVINVEQLESGLYSIAIIFDDNKIVKKFTK
ncbi:MAG: T9SS type A sorting domain-containing protein [Flavobacteriales bacterium]|nr:T9SS type A sorting domain-containing protein [Flavobacteriales bacterium]